MHYSSKQKDQWLSFKHCLNGHSIYSQDGNKVSDRDVLKMGLKTRQRNKRVLDVYCKLVSSVTTRADDNIKILHMNVCSFS